MPSLNINPPLFNSANPWCTSLKDLRELYQCPFTGAVTTRTSLLDGFSEDEKHHSHLFFKLDTQEAARGPNQGVDDVYGASLNTYGYSPLPLVSYLGFIEQISSESGGKKPFVISVTGSAEEVVECYRRITETQRKVTMPLAMEIK